MKFLQILVELLLFALTVLELVFTIQLNATVRVPMKITVILILMIIMFVVLLAFEWHEGKNARERVQKIKNEYEAKIAEMKKEQAKAESRAEAVKQAAKKAVEMDKPIDVDLKQE